ncbi:MAG: T9SS type A sorting domain-containing protein [Candidatus Nomurabacteria bacterium]|nr:T9SS type A sorting domain-containing protein [Candidatus Nomurabacteria bacterium]
MHGCICLPDSLESCDPVSVFYDMDHLGYVDNCDNQSELELTLQVFQSGVIAPIATVTNSDFQMNLAPGVYTFVMTATDLHGNVDTTIHNLVIECPGPIGSLEKSVTLSVAPNPTSGEITVAFGSNLSALVSVRGETGEFISATKVTGDGKIDLSDLPAGVYYVTARSEESTSTKLVVLIK